WSWRCRSNVVETSSTLWDMPALGRAAADPAVGTTVITRGSVSLQRPIAVFPGGSNTGLVADIEECSDDLLGRAIYVVDLQTGTLIRRFVDYRLDVGSKNFDAAITGSPALYNDFPGSIVTRGFVGDAEGRLFRIDMTNPDPQQWFVHLFFDPQDPKHCDSGDPFLGSTLCESGGFEFGAANYRPAVAMTKDRNVVVVYGLGETNETSTSGKVQGMLAIEEKYSGVAAGATNIPSNITPNPVWRQFFNEREALTGEPIIFDNNVYFTTYNIPEDVCEVGNARIWGLSFRKEDASSEYEPVGAWTQFEGYTEDLYTVEESSPPLWFGPVEPTLIRGLAVTMGPVCATDFGSTGEGVDNQVQRKPQLVAQVGQTAMDDSQAGTYGGTETGHGISRITVDLEPPQTQAIPLSWTVINN
ncbi:MAG: hypothetical protein ACNA8W_07610, partial [Bradymonadaceae bacterium]